MSDIISQVWPEWHVETMIGRGSYGTVYRAVRSGHGHTSYAAIKVIEIPQGQAEADELISSGMDAASVRSYFEQRARNVLGEVAFMEELKGAPNIVGVEDYQLVEHEGGIGWTVLVRMPLLKSLKERFAEIGQPDARETARLGVDICRALTICHTRGLIHRDVKPENIFFGPYGYLLGDFGIARRLGPDASSAHTRAGAFPYMAPEVFAGKGYGANVDTYSLGLVLYRYLNNGRAPFLPTDGPFNPSDSERAVALRLAGRAIPAPKNADANLASIVLRATNPDPSKRFSSAAEMGAALEAWALGKSAASSTAAAGSGPETVVLDPEQDSGTGRATAGAAAAGAARAATPPRGSAQGSYGPSGTVRADVSPQARQTGYAGQPYGQPTKTPGGSAPVQGATPRQASAPQKAAQGSPSGSLSGRTGAIIAIVVVALLLLALLSTMPLGCGSSSAVVETPPVPQYDEPNADDGSSISMDKTIIDDDICTLRVIGMEIDGNGSLNVFFDATNNSSETIEIDPFDTLGEQWQLNGTDISLYGETVLDPGESTSGSFASTSFVSMPVDNVDDISSLSGGIKVTHGDATERYTVDLLSSDGPQSEQSGSGEETSSYSDLTGEYITTGSFAGGYIVSASLTDTEMTLVGDLHESDGGAEGASMGNGTWVFKVDENSEFGYSADSRFHEQSREEFASTLESLSFVGLTIEVENGVLIQARMHS